MATHKRILFLADHLGYANGVAHGVTTYCRTVFPNIRAEDIELQCVFLGHEHPAADALRAAGIKTTFLNQGKYGLRALRSLQTVLARYRPDLVHVTQQKSTAIARLLKPVYGYSLLAHVHDFDPVPAMLRFLDRMLPQPERTVCVASGVIATALSQYGIKRDACTVLYNGLDLTRFQSADPASGITLRRNLGIDEQAPVIGTASRISVEKRVDKFITDMAQVLASCPTAHVIVAGDGSELEACRQLAERLGISKSVHFVGYQNDVRSVILASDVIALYGVVEACPFGAIEGLALGKPVVGFAAGGMVEIVSTDRVGVLVQQDDRQELIDRTISLLQDRHRCKAMADDCRRQADRFSLEQHRLSLLGHYRALTSRDSPARHMQVHAT